MNNIKYFFKKGLVIVRDSESEIGKLKKFKKILKFPKFRNPIYLKQNDSDFW